MKIKTLLQFGIILSICTLIACYLIFSDQNMVDVESLLYITLLSAAIILTIKLGSKMNFPILVVLIIYVFQRYILSGFVMIFFTGADGGVTLEQFRGFTSHEYNVSLRYALFGYCAVAAGLIIGVSKVPINVRTYGLKKLLWDSTAKHLSGYMVLIYAITILLINLFSYYILGERYVGIRPDDEGGWWRIFYNANIPLIMTLSILFFGWEKIRHKDKYKLYAALFVMFVGSVHGGSRSFLYTIFINFGLIFMLLKNGNFRVVVNLKLLAMFLLVSAIIFPVATILRYRTIFEESSSGIYENIAESASYLFGSSDSIINNMAQDILLRLNSFDTSMVIMNDRNIMPFDDLLSPQYIIGRIINYLVPGEIFHNLIDSQYLFDHIYYNRFVGWNAVDWGLWEEFYLIFGYWLGLVILFIFMIMIGYLWRKLLLSQSPYKLFYVGTFVYFLFLRLLINFEISLVISSVIVQLIVFNILIRVLFILSAAFGMSPIEMVPQKVPR